MLLTKLYRPRDFSDWYQQAVPQKLPNNVWGMVWLAIRLMPFYYTIIVLLGTGLIHGMNLLIPYLTKVILDQMAIYHPTDPEGMAAIMHGLYLMIAVMLVRMVTNWVVWVTSYNWHPMYQKLSYTIRKYTTEHSPQFFENDLSGRIIQKANSLMSSTQSLVDTFLWNWWPALVYFIITLCMLSNINLVLGLAGFVWFLLIFAAAFWLGRDVSVLSARSNEAVSQVIGRFADVVTNIRSVIFFTRQHAENATYRALESDVSNLRRRTYLSILNIRVFQQLMNIIAVLGIIGGTVYLWSHQQASLGDVALASMLTLLFVARANELAEGLPTLMDTIGVARDSLKTLVKPRLLVDAPNATDMVLSKGQIDFSNIGFSYDGGTQIFSNDFNLTIPAGQRVGIVGLSGAGKTTLVNLLLRLYDIQHGQIAIDEQDISKVTQQSLRKAIAFIPQDTVLFHRSIAENIMYGRPEASEHEMIAAAKAAFIHDFIAALPQGYATLVGERGIRLSGGQRQRVAIARALLKNAPILVLDEATSALDSEAEHEIQTAIRTAMQGKTVIAIAHRLSTIAHLDRIVVLDKGKIAEDGTHADLLARQGLYAQLWARQTDGFLPSKL